MNGVNQETHNGRTFGSILFETKEELKEFVETRIELFKTEMRDRLKMIKTVAPSAVIGLVFLGTSYLMFTLAVAGAIVGLLHNNPFRWCFGFLAVSILWGIIGAVSFASAKRRFHAKELVPKRTLDVLRQDKAWIQTEVRTQI
jgi:hypothetical protein